MRTSFVYDPLRYIDRCREDERLHSLIPVHRKRLRGTFLPRSPLAKVKVVGDDVPLRETDWGKSGEFDTSSFFRPNHQSTYSFRLGKGRRRIECIVAPCSQRTFRKGLERHAFPSPSTRQPHQTIRSLYVIYLALSEGLEDLGNVGGEAHVDKHHLRELREGKRDEFASGTK